MNKKLLPLMVFAAVMLSAGFTSCKKCLKCNYTEKLTSIPREREFCGSREELDKFKKDVIKEAKAFGNDEDEVKCAYK
ncbi:MAG: hypothetical protein MH137_02740 [Flavobacteriales bacterium]|nr:hypothetical protein [Flavobacteriales bacterium]